MFVLKSLSIFVLLLSAPLSLSQRGSDESIEGHSDSDGPLDKLSPLRKLKKGGRKNQKQKTGKKYSANGNGEDEAEEEEEEEDIVNPSCQIEQVETILNKETGEEEEITFYTLDPSCERTLSCEERSSKVLTCQEDAAGECVCEKACITKSTLSTTCTDTPSGCVCNSAWIVSLFAHADTNEDNKLSQEELFDWHQSASCADSFTYKGKTYYNECTTEGYSEDAVEKYPWCSIKVDNAGNHVTGFYKYCVKAGFDSEWEMALSFDTDGDNMLSFDEMLAFEGGDYYFSVQSVESTESTESTEFLGLQNQLNNRHVVNLDEDFQTNDLFNNSSGAMRVKRAFDHFNVESRNHMLGVMVIENGVNVAEFYNEDLGVRKETKFYQWSVTKTVMALLIGQMMKEHPEVTYETKLYDLHPEAREVCQNWLNWLFGGVTDCFHLQRKKQRITLRQLLTMTSGMHDCGNPTNIGGVDTLGGRTAWRALHLLYYKQTNVFCPLNRHWYGQCTEKTEDKCSAEGYHYILASNLLSYILKDRTGMGPEEYVMTKLAPKLGLDESDIEWCENPDGVGSGYHGLKLTLSAMAKIGQFYLQGGKARVDETEADMLTTEEYMNDVHYGNIVDKYVNEFPTNTYPQPDCELTENRYDCGNKDFGAAYYSHFIHVDVERGNYCAVGAAGKLICWSPRNNRVIAITYHQRDIDSSCGMSLISMALGVGNEEAMELYQYIDAGLDGGEPYDFTVAA